MNGACEENVMPRTKKRLKIKTVIHRARKYVQEGNKTEAINTIVRDTHYTVEEAEKLAEYIGVLQRCRVGLTNRFALV